VLRTAIGCQMNCASNISKIVHQSCFYSDPSPNVELTEIAAITTCELECDCLVTDILNSSINHANIGDCEMANPGLRFIWRDEIQRHKRRGEILKTAEV
jgi:hypothetical protein